MMAPESGSRPAGEHAGQAGSERDGLLGGPTDGDSPQEVTQWQKICGPLDEEYRAWEHKQREQLWAERAPHLYPPAKEESEPRRSPSKESAETALDKTHREECAKILARPPKYKEGHICYGTFRAIIRGLLGVVAFYSVLDQLGTIKPTSFKPCNGKKDRKCHYMRFFGSHGSVPGSGPYFMQVENGVDTPITLEPWSFKAYLVKHEKNISATAESSKNVTDARLVNATYIRSMQSAKADLEESKNKSSNLNTFSLWSYRITKAPLVLASWPLEKAANYHEGTKYGVQNIASGVCPGKTPEEMRDFCEEEETKKKIQNHLANGMCRWAVTIGLVGWGLLRCTHDVLLIYGCSEKTTLGVHQFSALFQGIAVASLFFWGMGATAVFATEELDVWGEGGHKRPCFCYYMLPDWEALLALGTPFLLLAMFAAKIQALGRASLYGDYMTMSLFHVPHYLARRSMLWTWGTMISPVVSGTRQIVAGEEREKMYAADYRLQRNIHLCLSYLRMMVYFFVSLAACPFMVRLKEVMIGLYTSEWVEGSPFKKCVVKYIFMLMPTIVTWVMGLEMLQTISETCFGFRCQNCRKRRRDSLPAQRPEEEAGAEESEEGFLVKVEPLFFDWLLDQQDAMELQKQRPVFVNILASISWLGCSLFVLVNMIAVGQGLSPDWRFLFSPLDKMHPVEASISQAELWGSCGFIFMFVFAQRILSIVYSINEENALLKKLSSIKDQNNNKQTARSIKPWLRCLLKDKVEEPLGPAATA